jgi:hypothetical protein
VEGFAATVDVSLRASVIRHERNADSRTRSPNKDQAGNERDFPSSLFMMPGPHCLAR